MSVASLKWIWGTCLALDVVFVDVREVVFGQLEGDGEKNV